MQHMVLHKKGREREPCFLQEPLHLTVCVPNSNIILLLFHRFFFFLLQSPQRSIITHFRLVTSLARSSFFSLRVATHGVAPCVCVCVRFCFGCCKKIFFFFSSLYYYYSILLYNRRSCFASQLQLSIKNERK